MAITFVPYQKTKPWVVTWRQPYTKRKLSKSFASEEDAQAFAAVEEELARKEKNILKKSRKNKAPVSRLTVRELLESYFSLAHTNSTTIATARSHSASIIGAFGERMAGHLEIADILNFSQAQRLRGVAQITINRRVSILRAALNWGLKNALLASNPLVNMRLPHAEPRRIAPPTAQEANAILTHAAPHVQRVVILGLCTGARIGPSELFRLDWTDVDLENGMIRLPSAHKNHHAADGRDIPIRRALLPVLRVWKEHDGNRGRVISWKGQPVRCIGKAWRNTLKRAGIGRRIRPYDLRHAYATYSLAGGADIKTVAELMGHADASMILKTYQHVQDAQKRAAVEAMPDFLGLAKHAKGRVPGLNCPVALPVSSRSTMKKGNLCSRG